jgi:4-diphosphocytidyl-2-C-methyl-D-erythritol kinase
MVARGSDYLPAEDAERRLRSWRDRGGPLAELLFNNFEPGVFDKYVALPAMVTPWRDSGHAVLLSGSGSACFAIVGDDSVTAWRTRILAGWGESAFVQTARIL